MEQFIPEEAADALDNAALELVAEANRLAGRAYPHVQQAVGDLV